MNEKAQRIQNVCGTLEKKRFSFSKEFPETVNWVKFFKKIVIEASTQYEEIVGGGVTGSIVKGYANLDSDVDALVFIEYKPAIKRWKNDGKYDEKKTLQENLKEIKDFFRNIFAAELKKTYGLKDSQVEHIFINFCDKKFLNKILTNEPTNIRAVKELFVFFLLGFGTGLLKYRKLILDLLRDQGEKGLKKWKVISDELFRIESSNIPENILARRKKLYPITLEKAIELYDN